MAKNTTIATTRAAASRQQTAAEAELEALNPKQQAIVRDVMRHHPLLSLEEALAHLKEAGL